MTKRERQTRIREIQAELLARMRKRFPRIEHLRTEERRGRTVVIEVYAPYEDKLAVLATTSQRIVELAVDEGLDVMVLPLSQKTEQRAA